MLMTVSKIYALATLVLMLAGAVAPLAQADIDAGLQGNWTFDDEFDPTKDFGPNFLHGTNHGV